MYRVMIIDDSKTAQTILASILEPEYLVEIKNDAVSALAAIESFPPDLILLDVNMPGMDGFEACKILKQREKSRDIPIIFITSLDSEMEKFAGFEAGGDDYVVKPVYPLELIARVRAHLGARKARLDAVAMERMAVFREIAVALCHEINNPLTSVNAYLHILKRDLSAQHEPLHRVVCNLQTEIGRIANITSRLSSATSASVTKYHRNINMIDLGSQKAQSS